MVMCQRKREVEKCLEVPEAEGLWTSGPTRYYPDAGPVPGVN